MGNRPDIVGTIGFTFDEEEHLLEFKAVEDPILIRESRLEQKNVTKMALNGRSQVTVESHGLNGKPRSLAKANNCREAVDTAVRLETSIGTITKAVIAVVALTDSVALKNTCIKGIPVGDEITLFKSPRQKQSVMIMIHPRPPLTTVLMIMDLGKILLASWSSSDTIEILSQSTGERKTVEVRHQ